MKIFTFKASEIAKLDSDVYKGGGTDDTRPIQAVLDMADETTGVRLIMDGCALVSTLRVGSNTRIECLGKSCGFFQVPGVIDPIITNKNWCFEENLTKNVEIIGGTYNQDCINREKWRKATEYEQNFTKGPMRAAFALEFYGVENFLMRDVTVVDFRTYAFMIGGFKNCIIEDTWLELPHHMDGNQDGFHFWGPGQFLTVKNVGGRVGDDFMNVGPDEGDGVSSITDVLVDGVFLDEADQAIRLLSVKDGLLDRVTLRNISGTYKSFGFYIDPWFENEKAGNFGDIFIENVNLEQMKPNYTYHNPILFSVGGDIRCLTVKNVRHEYPCDERSIFEIGVAVPEKSYDPDGTLVKADGSRPVIKNLIIDGLTIIEKENAECKKPITVCGKVENFVLKNVLRLREQGMAEPEPIVTVTETGEIVNNYSL